MSDHILELLGAYLDGELHGGQLHKVETHLDECQPCLEEYYALQALSVTLHAAPVPDFPSPERFAAEVALRLPRTPVKHPVSRRAVELGWWLAPVGLIVVWIFVSTTILVSNVVTTANELGLLSSVSTWLVSGSPSGANYSAFLEQFGLLENGDLQLFTVSESFTRTFITSVFWQISLAMLYISWIAIWWARHTRQGIGQPLDSGSRPTVKLER